MPSGNGEPRIPEQLRVVVSVEVDEARGHDKATRVDHLFGVVGRNAPDFGDASVFDPDVAANARGAGPIDDHSVFNDNVEFWHQLDLRIG